MGYAIPSLDELPDPTLEEFSKNPEYYWGKLREYESTPYWFRHFGLADIRKRIIRLVRILALGRSENK